MVRASNIHYAYDTLLQEEINMEDNKNKKQYT